MHKKIQIERGKKQISIIETYKKVFMGPDGELVLFDLMRRCGVLDPMYSGDVNQMLIKEGSRQVVLKILRDLQINVEEIRERMDEYARSNE